MKKTVILVVIGLLAFALAGCLENNDNLKNDDNLTQPEMKLSPEEGDSIVILKTNHGDVSILLYRDQAPITTKNFLELSKDGKYDNSIFHRIIDDFMIQGGDFENKNGTGGHTYMGPGTYLEDEFGEGLEHVYGAVSMANAGPNTGSSQFFIVQAKEGTPWLNGAHAIFGYVYDGMDTIEKISDVEIDGADKPLEDVIIQDVIIIDRYELE